MFPGNGEVGWILVEKISLCPEAVLNEVRVPADLSKIKVEFFLVFSAQEREKLVAVGIVPLRERGGGKEGEREYIIGTSRGNSLALYLPRVVQEVI